jgi:hypothetical protein
MYADDIILLSSTAEGLQAKLDILDSYCNDWCLTVNPTKTKILVFNKAGRHLRFDTGVNDSVKCLLKIYKAGKHSTIFRVTICINYTFQYKQMISCSGFPCISNLTCSEG